VTIVNIRGTSGSGKSTLVRRFLDTFAHEAISGQLSNWKKPKIVAYKVFGPAKTLTYVVGPYRTQCGGCDALSYKGSHNDIEAFVREYLPQGNVIFEGLTISSTVTRWMNISKENPGRYVWTFMNTPEEECYQRIMSRNGGREPKRDAKGQADYNIKYRGCMNHVQTLISQGERVLSIGSDDAGYQKMIEVLE
jgi:energy-coupling factor transporter ATP-binding protein EcfA2